MKASWLACAVLLWSGTALGEEPAPAFGDAPRPERARDLPPETDETEAEPPSDAFGTRTTSTVDGEAEAGEPKTGADGAYGRFEGDLDLGVGAGAELEAGELRGALYASLHYFWMIGVYGSYRDSFSDSSAIARQVASLGVDMRPAFIPRWSKDMQHGPGFLDLTIDSISLGLGAYFTDEPGGSLGDGYGFEASLGLGLPLFARATGLWLQARGVMRWGDGDPGTSGLFLLSWHQMLSSPLGD